MATDSGRSAGGRAADAVGGTAPADGAGGTAEDAVGRPEPATGRGLPPAIWVTAVVGLVLLFTLWTLA